MFDIFHLNSFTKKKAFRVNRQAFFSFVFVSIFDSKSYWWRFFFFWHRRPQTISFVFGMLTPIISSSSRDCFSSHKFVDHRGDVIGEIVNETNALCGYLMLLWAFKRRINENVTIETEMKVKHDKFMSFFSTPITSKCIKSRRAHHQFSSFLLSFRTNETFI